MASVTIHFQVTDPAAVIEAAAQHLLETNTYETIEDCREAVTDLDEACRLLIDPGSEIPGLTVHDSTFERIEL